MKLALQISSWICTAMGALAVLFWDGNGYSLLGGGLFLVQGILALRYVHKH